MDFVRYQRKVSTDFLSPREIQCLYWAMNDKSIKATSRVLNISPETVKKHRQALLQKLECKSMASAVACAMKRGLVFLEYSCYVTAPS